MTLQRSGDTDGDALTLSPPAAGAGSSHNLLSATHDDTEVNSPTLGSIIKGDATSEWAELAVGTAGQQLTVDEAGTDLEYGLASKYLLATKGTGGTITAGQVVYMTGWNSGLSVTNVELADSDLAANAMPAIGIAFEDIVNGSTGRVLLMGVLEGIDTSALNVDQSAYVSGTAGSLTSTQPTGTALIQAVAFVGRSHASAGQLIVMGAGRTNDLPQLATGNIWVGDATGLPVVGTVTHPAANKLDELASIQGTATNSLTLLHSDGTGVAFKTLAVTSSTSYPQVVSSSTDAPYITGAGASGNAGIAIKAIGTGNVDLTPDLGTVDVTKGGLTITAGGLTVTAGGATVTAGDVVVTAGDLTLTVGDLALSAGHAHFGTIVNNTGAAPLIDLTLGNIQKLTLSVNTIPTVTDPTGIGTINILVIQAGTAYTVDWSNFPVTWTDAEGEPDLSTVSKKYIVTLLFDGTNYFGNFKGPFT